jgi:hypothetical protein
MTHNAGERLVEKRMQCSLDLVRVVLMQTVEQAAVDKSANVVGADLDRHTNKAAVAAIAMPSLTDGGSRLIHDHSLLGPTRYIVTDLVACRRANKPTAGHPTTSTRPHEAGRVAGAIIAVVNATILDQTETSAVSNLAEHPLPRR